VASIDDAYAWCRSLASSHYENFPVASLLAPSRLRRSLTALYAFSRLGDDIADEDVVSSSRFQVPGSRFSVEDRLQALQFMDDAVDQRVDTTGHPVFMALHHTMQTYHLPTEPFHRLIEAFRSDVQFSPPSNWNEVHDYSHRSADPVGEIILRMDGSASHDAIAASDHICTALQITNFIQDVERDAQMGRRYLPGSVDEAVDIAFEHFVLGTSVVDHVRSWRLRQELKLIIAAGSKALSQRRRLDKMQYLGLLARLVTRSWSPAA
jgi:hydroxysqualene synthase